MPTIFYEKGFRLYFYSNERDEPPHIHVQYQAATAKFWIEPVSLARNKSMSASELRRAFQLAQKRERLIKEKWNEYFN